MKSFGFTLAEVLITLSIIGVVAAITLPSLNTAIQKNKVGPTLRKFINTMENANEHLLVNVDGDVITDAVTTSNAYLNAMRSQLKGSIDNIDSPNITSFDGTDLENYSNIVSTNFTFEAGDAMAVDFFQDIDRDNVTTPYKGLIANIIYDMNGFEKEPNRLGKDIFLFRMDDNGSIIPWGGKAEMNAYPIENITTPQWEGSATCGNGNTTDNGEYCAGSVVDNDWKVIYKY